MDNPLEGCLRFAPMARGLNFSQNDVVMDVLG